jgi:hypothetical protein
MESIDQLLDDWHDQVAGHSFEHTMLRGPAFDKVMEQPTDVVIAALLNRLKTSAWMGYQGLLRRLTGADIWKGQNVTPQMRAYDVQESAKAWIEWGKTQGILPC